MLFFKKLIQSFPDFKYLKNLHEFNIVDKTVPTDSINSIIHTSLLYKNVTGDDTNEGVNTEHNDIQVENNNIQKPIDILEDPKSLDYPANGNGSHDHSRSKNNTDVYSNQKDDNTS